MRKLWTVVAGAVFLGGCAGSQASVYAEQRTALSGVDDFNVLLLGGGLPVQVLPRGGALAPAQAEHLLAELRLRAPGPGTYAPRLVAEALLWGVLLGKEEAAREELNRRLRRYQRLAVLTPEGFMSWALTGEPVEWMGKVEVVGGEGRARQYVVGSLYAPEEGAGWRRVEWEEGG